MPECPFSPRSRKRNSNKQLAKIGEQMGKKAEARENFRKFLDLWKDADQGFPEVEDTKKRLASPK